MIYDMAIVIIFDLKISNFVSPFLSLKCLIKYFFLYLIEYYCREMSNKLY